MKPVDAFQRDLLTKPQQQTLQAPRPRGAVLVAAAPAHEPRLLPAGLGAHHRGPLPHELPLRHRRLARDGSRHVDVVRPRVDRPRLGMVIQPSDRTLIRMTAYMLTGLWGFLGLLDGVTAHKCASDAAYPIFYAVLWALWCVLNICSAVAVCQGSRSTRAPRRGFC